MTNGEARAYVALAMEKNKMSNNDIARVISELNNLFDTITEYDAVEYARPIFARTFRIDKTM
ncbi:hypothetical protein AAXB25_14755 [Paenibacillus lautus]|uniref:hypothetical protein n=1 Tax=Paenibacillus lautus TaxID=1401 RepID=UPI003D267F6B